MKIRQFVTIIFGFILLYYTWQTKYKCGLLDAFLWLGLILFGSIFFIISIIKDYKQYREEKVLRNFAVTFTFIGFVLLATGIALKIDHDFNKPSFVKAYYDGDFNGAGIDLKTDSTSIGEDSAIGFSNYTYGEYSISNNIITINEGSGITKRFVIKKDNLEFYLAETDSSGTETDGYIKYTIIKDNRK